MEQAKDFQTKHYVSLVFTRAKPFYWRQVGCVLCQFALYAEVERSKIPDGLNTQNIEPTNKCVMILFTLNALSWTCCAFRFLLPAPAKDFQPYLSCSCLLYLAELISFGFD